MEVMGREGHGWVGETEEEEEEWKRAALFCLGVWGRVTEQEGVCFPFGLKTQDRRERNDEKASERVKRRSGG